jgi:hypothetical protein
MDPGGGKYDHDIRVLLEIFQASSVMLIVHSGYRGNGFAVASRWPIDDREVIRRLRTIADQIEQHSAGTK